MNYIQGVSSKEVIASTVLNKCNPYDLRSWYFVDFIVLLQMCSDRSQILATGKDNHNISTIDSWKPKLYIQKI